MTSQWIDEFEQWLWEFKSSGLHLRFKIEEKCMEVLKKRGFGACIRLKQYITEKRLELDCKTKLCNRMTERAGLHPDVLAVIRDFRMHYFSMSTKFLTTQNVLEAICEI